MLGNVSMNKVAPIMKQSPANKRESLIAIGHGSKVVNIEVEPDESPY
jgi:hypothetical protein